MLAKDSLHLVGGWERLIQTIYDIKGWVGEAQSRDNQAGGQAQGIYCA
jgi:hypothetical protein